MSTFTFTLADGLKVQAEQLHGWRAILKEEVYSKLVHLVLVENLKLPPTANGFDVFRGTDINALVHKLSQQIVAPEKIFTFDIQFSVRGDWASWQDIPAQVLIDALQKRLDNLKKNPNEILEGVGHVDTDLVE